ncbi:MAG: DEAD/DEAH box helicase [Dysgonomonas sp.]
MKDNPQLNKEDHNKYLEEAYRDTLTESCKLYDEAKSDDLLDLDIPVAIPLFDGLHSIRNADIREEKLYLDEEKKNIRYFYKNKEDGNIRNEAVILLNDNDNRLSEIITQLPYGLIDKQATGIGATYSEMYSKRNSIIVVPTRALGENKCGNDSNFLYVGTQRVINRVTTDIEINNYLNNTIIEYKKIVVVADSLKKVIDCMQTMGIDVYREYFLMVDEIDTIQSDNHFRPQLSNVIDYYYKFKLQRRALVSATVKEFSHPKLQKEPLTTIRRKEPIKRNITLLYTNNINELLKEEIVKINTDYPTDKILIAYNSITDIQLVIGMLSENIKNRCGILCSETNYTDDRIKQQYRAEISPEDSLSHDITFMTCAYFAGLDICDRCHLITISSVLYNYTILPINKITQIAGRCRNGLISYSIIYDSIDKPFYYIENYKDKLIDKADKMVKYFAATKELTLGDEDLKVVFERIKPVLIDKSYESVFKGKSISLTRENALDKKFEICYFNIDVLYEQMVSYSRLYSDKNSLFKTLKKEHNVPPLVEKIFEQTTIEASSNTSNESRISRIQTCIDDFTPFISSMDITSRFNVSIIESELETKIRTSGNFEKDCYYSRVKELYRYIDINILNQKLLEICTEKNNVKYKRFRNAVYFWALDDNHLFKQNIKTNFIIDNTYPDENNEDIPKKLFRILDQHSFRRSSLTDGGVMRFLNSIIECKRCDTRNNTYKVINHISKLLVDLNITIPITTIPPNKEANRIFKV